MRSSGGASLAARPARQPALFAGCFACLLPDRGPPGPLMNHEAGLEARGPARDPLYRLLAWLSPAYPIGAFSYSHGVETAVEEGFIKDRASLVTWLESVLLLGTGVVDGALFATAWRAAAAEDWPSFDAIDERSAAWRGTSEMELESRQQRS